MEMETYVLPPALAEELKNAILGVVPQDSDEDDDEEFDGSFGPSDEAQFAQYYPY